MVYVIVRRRKHSDYKAVVAVAENLAAAETFLRRRGTISSWDRNPDFYPLGWVTVVEQVEGCDYSEAIVYTIEQFEILK